MSTDRGSVDLAILLGCNLPKSRVRPKSLRKNKDILKLAEGRGFEPPVALRLRLISSQVPLTTQPPFRSTQFANQYARISPSGKLIWLRVSAFVLLQSPSRTRKRFN